MNKSIIIRGSIIMGLFLAVIGAAVGCSMIKKDAEMPQISNGDDVYLSLADFDLTKEELWETMKNVDGLAYLMDYVDEIILADYLGAAISQQEIDERVDELTFLTENKDTIAEVKADPELAQEFIDAFRQNMIIIGYDPDDADDLRAYVELDIAKTNMAKDYIRDAEVGNNYELTSEDLEDYYNYVHYNNACALEVRFNSTVEAGKVLDNFDLVPNYSLGFGKYVGTEDIEDVATDDFTSINTNKLENDEVFEEFIRLFNYMNPWMDDIDPGIDEADFCADYSDMATFDYSEVISTALTGDPNVELVTYISQILDLEDEDTIPYSYNLQAFGDLSMLVYKVSQEPRTPYEDLTADILIDLKAELIDLYVTEDVITDIMDEKRADAGFEILDPNLQLQYFFNNAISFDNDGSKTNVAKLDDVSISADDLYDFMEARVGTFYSIEITKIKRIILGDEYEDVYGSDRDYLDNNSDEMKVHRDELRTMKSMFSSNTYAQYGFSSNDYTWEEFLYLAFGATSENKVLETLYIVGKIQPSIIYPTIAYESAMMYIQSQIDDYFSLQVEHALIFIDFDKDFAPDSFDDFRDTFDAAELDEYNTLKVAFQDLILQKYNVDEMTLEEIITEFNDGLNDDVDNEWAQFKAYGFNIMTERLSLDDGNGGRNYNLNHLNSTTLDDNFKNSLKRLYDLYTETQNTEKTEIVDDRLTVTDFGMHFIIVDKGDNFEQPTVMCDDDCEDGFTFGSGNDTNIPTQAQMELYMEIKYAGLEGIQAAVLLPSTVYNALEAYYLTTFSAYFSQTGYSLVTTSYILDNSPVYSDDNAETLALLEDILEALYEVNFQDGFIIPE